MESTVKSRLLSFIRHEGLSIYKFEKTCGLSTGYVGNIRVSIQPEKVKSIAHCFPNLNTGWLLTGEGEMLKKENVEASGVVGGGNQHAFLVPVLPTEASAGRLSDFADGIQEYECEMMVSPVRDATLAMGVFGDSMSPEYPSGCRVLLKKVNPESFIEWGRVYVLDTENGAIIKEVHHCDDESLIECVSQNPDPKYSPFRIPKESIFGWYKVIMVLSFK